jgi:hypothetical protein
MIQRLWIPGALPSMNDIIDMAKGANGRGAKYSKTKRELTQMIAWHARAARLKPVAAARLAFHWCEVDKKRDPDNIAAARKFALDGLVVAKVLPNDGWKEILGWSDTFEVTAKAGVLVTIDDLQAAPARAQA